MTPDEARTRMETLAATIHYHNRRYYQEDAPEIPDSEYDALLRELQDLEALYPEWAAPDSPTRRVGAPPLDKFAPVTHLTPLLSLANAFSSEELREFDQRCRRFLENDAPLRYTAEPKLDGLAVNLRYERGRFTVGATRGDGSVGEDVTLNLRTIPDLPLVIPRDAGGLEGLLPSVPERIEIRGEVCMEHEAFHALNRRRSEEGSPPLPTPGTPLPARSGSSIPGSRRGAP